MASSRKVVVEVVSGRDLMPKDGQGSASPYVQVDFDGRRFRTQTQWKQLNPVWNETFEFELSRPTEMDDECLEFNVYNDKSVKQQRKFLGRVSVPGHTVKKRGEEELQFYNLQKRGMFSSIKGQLGLKVCYYDEQPKPPEPVAVKVDDVPAAAAADAAVETPVIAVAAAVEAPVTAAVAAVETPATAPAEKPKEEAQKVEEKKDEKPPEEAKAEEKKETEKKDEKKEAKKQEKKEGQKKEETEEKKAEKKGGDAAASTAAAGGGKEEKAKEKKVEVLHIGPPPPLVAPAPDPAEYMLKATNPPLGGLHGEKSSTYDMVEKMQYLYVRVVKARGLAAREAAAANPYVKLIIGNKSINTPVIPKCLSPEWNLVFAFGREVLQGAVLRITLWDEGGAAEDEFLGAVWFDLQEIPIRVPPDSPLAPQWYRLEDIRGQGRVQGDIMLSVWMGTQADEAFAEAWISDTGGYGHNRSKVYLSPKLWYLRVNVIEAQDLLQPSEKSRHYYPEVSVRVRIGFQEMRTRIGRRRSNSGGGSGEAAFWNEDLLFVAAEPFEEEMMVVVEAVKGKQGEEMSTLGHTKLGLTHVEKRFDHRPVPSKWYDLERSSSAAADNKEKFTGRLHLRLCYDGGYHVIDEGAYMSSDLRPAAKQLWKKPVGVLEMGILGAQSLLPMKTKDGRGSIDAYCVAKYGMKWVRTRTVMDSFQPRWNEQYTWEVYDPCTVLTVGVFDNSHMQQTAKERVKDASIGKVRIRLSTLEANRIYTNAYPLLVLHPSGTRRMGELELAVRFSVISTFNVMHAYIQPLLPTMHYLHPLTISQQDYLRRIAMRMVTERLARSEPPLKPEVVKFMLDTDSSFWSLRRTKANWYRVMSVIAPLVSIGRWVDDVCQWRNPVTSILVHVLFLILVCFPDLILPTAFLYMFLIGAWHYRFRPRSPSHMDARISHADAVTPDELDEEFDTVPSSKPTEVIRARYERLRALAAKIQTVLGDVASQGERLQGLLSWRDPRATAIFVTFCLLLTVSLYALPSHIIILLLGLYFFRHPRFRHRRPPVALNFFRRLPSFADRVL